MVPLVEGIENLQLEYGVDTDVDGDSDVYTTDPTTVANWSNVLATRVNLLARNPVPSSGHVDTKRYVLGALSDGTPNTIAARNDAYKRHVFQALVNLPNPTGRNFPE